MGDADGARDILTEVLTEGMRCSVAKPRKCWPLGLIVHREHGGDLRVAVLLGTANHGVRGSPPIMPAFAQLIRLSVLGKYR
jgi:hypothetical protein